MSAGYNKLGACPGEQLLRETKEIVSFYYPTFGVKLAVEIIYL